MDKPYLIHFHFHGRRTGVTRSVENIILPLQQSFHAFLFGYGIDGPRLGLGQLLRIIFGKQKTIIHAHRNLEMQFALLLRFFGASFKLIATRHAETKPSKLTLWLLKKADAVVALIPTLSLPMPTVVIGHGIDTSYFTPHVGKIWPGIIQKNIISVVGRVRKAKGQHVFMEAVLPLLMQHPDWAVAIVGKIDKVAFKTELDQAISKHQVASQVYFVSETRDIRSVYQASRAVVVPSFSEGFSLVPLEAMSCQCVVAATEHVGIHSDLITNNETGFLFEKGNVQQLQKILIKVFSEDLSTLAIKARNVAVSKWDVKKQVEALKALYLLED